MKFSELKQVINRHPGRHDKIAVSIGLGNDAIIEAESPRPYGGATHGKD